MHIGQTLTFQIPFNDKLSEVQNLNEWGHDAANKNFENVAWETYVKVIAAINKVNNFKKKTPVSVYF